MNDLSYLHGAHAFRHNEECDDIADELHNPHPEGTLLFDAWQSGYNGAKLCAEEDATDRQKQKTKTEDKAMTPPLIKCAYCDGTGHIKLHEHLWRTLAVIKKAKSPTSRQDIEEAGITPNAINNRLVALEALGLIKRTGRNGKFILWEAVMPAAQSNSTTK